MQDKPIIISLGGSLIVPSEIDVDFIKKFKAVIEKFLSGNETLKIVVIVGGGKIARTYQKAATDVATLTDEDADWLGIHCTRLNAHLLRTIFKDIAHPRVFSSSDDVTPFDEPLAIGAGWRPGWSTDFCAASIAGKLGARRVINLSNTDYVYDKDPNISSNARRIEKISWCDYRDLIPAEWSPGLNSPFDPVAAEKAEQIGLEVAILNGDNMENFERCLRGENFDGTRII